VAWLRNDRVHHLKRGTTLRETLPLTSLVSAVSPLRLQSSTSGERKDLGEPDGAPGALGHLSSPRVKDWGAAESGRGKESTPPVACHVRLPCCTREAPRRMGRDVDRRKGETLDAIPMSARSGGWGVGVGGRESRLHGDGYPRRRPLAREKREPQVASERAPCSAGTASTRR
jgi:hypothetical protein